MARHSTLHYPLIRLGWVLACRKWYGDGNALLEYPVDSPDNTLVGLKRITVKGILGASKHTVYAWATALHAGLNRLSYRFIFLSGVAQVQRIELARVPDLLAKRTGKVGRA